MTIKASSERCLVSLLCHTITGHYKCPKETEKSCIYVLLPYNSDDDASCPPTPLNVSIINTVELTGVADTVINSIIN